MRKNDKIKQAIDPQEPQSEKAEDIMRICPVCAKKYTHLWNFCPEDHAQLIEDEVGEPLSVAPKPSEFHPVENKKGKLQDLVNYIQFFILVGVMPAGFFITLTGFQKEYAVSKSIMAALFSRNGIFLILLIAAGIGLLRKYQIDSLTAGMDRRKLRRRRR